MTRIKEKLKPLGVLLVLVVATLLAVKFFLWNAWKLERAAAMAESILKAHPAVNLVISRGNRVLFQKGFPYNPNGNYYIVNGFDMTPHVTDTRRVELSVRLNGEPVSIAGLYRFKTFNILVVNGRYIIFTAADSGIETLVRLKAEILGVTGSLKKLSL
jgi:hypothetical protein